MDLVGPLIRLQNQPVLEDGCELSGIFSHADSASLAGEGVDAASANTLVDQFVSSRH